jgi:DNA mismatch repair ATPase MutS
MDEDHIYQDDRIGLLREYNTQLRKSLACIGHQKHEAAKLCFEEAKRCGAAAVKDNNQFYLKEMFNTYHKYYAAFKKIKYDEGAKWCLLQVVAHLRRLKMPKEKKTRLLADLISKYEAAGGERTDVRAQWQTPTE